MVIGGALMMHDAFVCMTGFFQDWVSLKRQGKILPRGDRYIPCALLMLACFFRLCIFYIVLLPFVHFSAPCRVVACRRGPSRVAHLSRLVLPRRADRTRAGAAAAAGRHTAASRRTVCAARVPRVRGMETIDYQMKLFARFVLRMC